MSLTLWLSNFQVWKCFLLQASYSVELGLSPKQAGNQSCLIGFLWVLPSDRHFCRQVSLEDGSMSGHSDDCEAGRGTEAKYGTGHRQERQASGAPAYSRMLSLSTMGLTENTNHKPKLTKNPDPVFVFFWRTTTITFGFLVKMFAFAECNIWFILK